MPMLYDMFGQDGSLTSNTPTPTPSESLEGFLLVGPTNWGDNERPTVCAKREGEWQWIVAKGEPEAAWYFESS